MYLLKVKAIIQSNFAVLTDEPCHLMVWNLVHCHPAPAVYKPCFQKRLSLYKLRLGSDVAFWWFPSRFSDFREVVGTEGCFWVTCHLLPLDLWEHQSPARVTVRCGCQEFLLPIQRPHLGSLLLSVTHTFANSLSISLLRDLILCEDQGQREEQVLSWKPWPREVGVTRRERSTGDLPGDHVQCFVSIFLLKSVAAFWFDGLYS